MDIKQDTNINTNNTINIDIFITELYNYGIFNNNISKDKKNCILYNNSEFILNKFNEIILNCYNENIKINLIEAELVIQEIINLDINPLKIISSNFINQSKNIKNNLEEITSSITANNFIKYYNSYFNGAINIRKIFKRFNNIYSNSTNQDIIYFISSYIFYKIVFDDIINNKTTYQLILNNIHNFNPTEIIDVIRILYHYSNFVKYIKYNHYFNFTYKNINLDFSKVNLDFVLTEICKNITELINIVITINDISDNKHRRQLILNIIQYIKIYTNIDIINEHFCKLYIVELNKRCLSNNINLELENTLIKAFDVITNNKYIELINNIITNKYESNNFKKYINTYDNSQIQITQDKYKNLSIPELSTININIINNINNSIYTDKLNSLSLDIYLDLVSKMYNNYTQNSKKLTYDFINSDVTFTLNTNNEYTFICNLIQYNIIDYINNNTNNLTNNLTIEDINHHFNFDTKIYIDSLLSARIIKYKDNSEDTNITFTLTEINNLINSINIVSELKQIVNNKMSKTKYFIINSDFKSKILHHNLIKYYTDELYKNELLNYTTTSEILNNTNNKDNKDNKNDKDDKDDKDDKNIISSKKYETNNIYIDGDEYIEIIEEIEIYEEESDNEEDNNKEDNNDDVDDNVDDNVEYYEDNYDNNFNDSDEIDD